MQKSKWAISGAIIAALAALISGGCGEGNAAPEPLTAFALRFTAVQNGQTVGCGDRLSGLGTTESAEAEISDLRFYVSNLQFFDAAGIPVPVELDQSEFQYRSSDGEVMLIDLTDASAGACGGNGLSYPEGTARTNDAITGATRPSEVRRVTFEIGVPQRIQKAVIAGHTAEDAPSPLREMHWSWGFAYRNLVMNFTVLDGEVAGEGYLHVGSTDCGGDGTRALTDRQSCGKPNAAVVSLDAFSLTDDMVSVDVGALLADLDFQVLQSEGTTDTVPGVACHSSPDQPDCAPIFANLGIEMTDGGASAAANTVFAVKSPS